MSTVEENTVFDIIFAGGGASACITAGRLAAADPNLKILIVEAGPHTREHHDHVQPARYFANLGLPKQTFTFHKGNPSPALLGRSPIVPAGRAVGGGSSINFVVYTRAAASDYDDWETVHGNKGWGSTDIIPLLKKAETYEPGSTNDTHGTSGPIHISFAPDLHNLADDFLEVAAAFDKERSVTEDTNTFHDVDKYGRWARYINGKTGRRSDAAHYYIYNQEANTNLTVLTQHRVVRVLFEGTRAVGIEYVDDLVGRPGGAPEIKSARASRLVVVSAGAFGSPSILERSGIGAELILKENNVKQLVHLPGVGEHYMDHNLVFTPFIASAGSDSLDALFRGTEEEISPYEQQWLKDGQGLMAHNGLDCGVKWRPNAKELAEMSPEFDHRWKTYFADAPDKPVMILLPFSAYAGADVSVPRGKYFSMAYFSGYPASVGRVHITSGSDPYAKLNFDAGFLDDPADVVILRWAYKKSREFARRMQTFRGDVAVGHPQFKPGSIAATDSATSPVPLSAPDIVYTKADNDAIDEYHRKTVETTWHSVGTCAMKPRDKGGVVDERLNVYGVQGLKVADCSITPGNVGANTYNTAIAIGEKAAVIIAEDLGIKGVTPA
ncbi:GMC oxidoreductase [Hypholoma sublateritium FD-334 SS-4]|uniref:pyranose dehydrogenase (acceptor) n=1 Tax=Hypholoma sublateritium (strain FD-334 SS-4) TaxID=945553 RepID=A0A0D2KIN7_HYPSF|nr:GMC oxidoreductase [Hypholoma sublateritium FD-334 SS-4]